MADRPAAIVTSFAEAQNEVFSHEPVAVICCILSRFKKLTPTFKFTALMALPGAISLFRKSDDVAARSACHPRLACYRSQADYRAILVSMPLEFRAARQTVSALLGEALFRARH
jgi:hypothetical protein